VRALIVRQKTKTMSEPNQQYAYFTVTGLFDPIEVTKEVRVEPTESWQQGVVNPRNGRERKFSRWSLESRLSREADLSDHITDVLDQLDKCRSGFQAIVSRFGGVDDRFGAWMQLVGYFHSYYPGFNLSAQTVKRLAEYGLSADFDFYYLYDDGREDTD
jgi:hypothetical protein